MQPQPANQPSISLVMTVYPVYHYLVDGAVSAIEKYWPDHPPLYIGQSTKMEIAPRLLEDLQAIGSEFVVTMHEDFHLCAPVKQDLFEQCLQVMRDDPNILSCSLTWEPSDIIVYHFPKTYYCNGFQSLDNAWDYAINLQMRIWRREQLMQLLAAIPIGTHNSKLEPMLTRAFRDQFPGHRCITYAFTNPPQVSTFTDATDKSDWIVAYDNIMHAKRRYHYKYPVYINNFNRLTTTRNMVDYLNRIPDAYPIVVDNASTYPPLLEWYSTEPCNVIRVENRGPWAPWTLPNIALSRDYYAVTDSDLDLTNVPTDLLAYLQRGLEENPQCVKVGLSLEINDLPDLESSQIIREWEQRFWARPLNERWFVADVDTTFALYRGNQANKPTVRPAIRANRPYTARHIPWYRIDSDEERYYSRHANSDWSTWSGWEKPVSERPAYHNHLSWMGKTA